ncbi:hypothetical protein GBA52_026522 [Prunus armeniaca]|nr:hypothetical protein GBA52_026522 [Prunus armeniaca]
MELLKLDATDERMALFSKAAMAKGMNPFVFVVYRQAFASLALAPFAFFFESSKDAPLSYTLLCKIFFISLSGITLSLNLYYVAINYTSATFAAATTTTIPAITFVMAGFVKGPIVKQYPAKLRLTTLQCFFSCIQSSFLAIAIERNPSAWKIGWDIHLLSVFYCGVIVTGITYWLQVWAIEKKGPVFTSMFTPLALLITAIFSAIMWKEALHWGSIGGGVLLVVGLYSVLWGKDKEDRKSEESEQKQESKEEVV